MASMQLSIPIINELGMTDPLPMPLAILESNLHVLKCNAANNPARWGEFIQHLCWPEEVPVPPDLFLIDITENRHYKLAMQAIEQLYPY